MHLMSMLECQNNDETFVYEEQLTINLSPFQPQSEISLTTILKKDLFASFFYLKQENSMNIIDIPPYYFRVWNFYLSLW